MSTDPKITDTLLYGYGAGFRMGQRVFTNPFVWDDDWLVVGDQRGHFGARAECVSVQFYRRPPRERYVIPPMEPYVVDPWGRAL